MRRGISYLMVAVLALALLSGATLATADPKKIKVKCDKGDSINAALMNDAEDLIIEINGMCQEKVVVERKNVTLRGADPMTDGITGPVLDLSDPNDRALVTVMGGVKGILFENLAITESQLRGLEVHGASFVDVENCRITGNSRGLQVADDGAATVTNTEFANNTQFQLATWSGGFINCTECTISAPAADGLLSSVGGRMFLTNSSVIVGGWGALTSENGYFSAKDTYIAADAWAVWATKNSQMFLEGGDIFGMVWAESKSMVWLEGVTQTDNSWRNYVGEDSNLNLIDATLIGETKLTRFSNGTAEGLSALGDLVCDRGADFFCDNPTTQVGGTSDCGQCPKP